MYVYRPLPDMAAPVAIGPRTYTWQRALALASAGVAEDSAKQWVSDDYSVKYMTSFGKGLTLPKSPYIYGSCLAYIGQRFPNTY